MEPTNRRVRRDGQSAGRKGGARAGRADAPKVKRTLSLRADLSRWLDVSAAEVGVDVCDLVDDLLRPLMRGHRAPTLSERLAELYPGAGRREAPDGGASGTVENVPIAEDLTARFFPDGDPSPGAGEGSVPFPPAGPDPRPRRRRGA